MGLSTKRLFTAAGVLLLLCAVLVGCGGGQSGGGGQDGEGPIKVGVITTLTGPIAQPGESILRGLEATADMINADGGIDGREIELEVRDDEGKPEVAARLVSELASDEEIPLILGPYPSTTVAAADPQARGEEIPMIPFTGAGYVPPPGEDSTWITVPIVNFPAVGDLFMQYATDQGWTRISSLNPTDTSGQLAEDLVDSLVEEYGVEAVARERYDPGAVDVTPQLGEIKAADPDVMLTYGPGEPASIAIRQAQQVGLDVPINISHANAGLSFLELIKDVPNDRVYVVSSRIYSWENLPDDDPQKGLFEGFTTAYSERFPDSEPGFIETLGTDVLLVGAEALRNAGPDREAIREYLSQGDQNIVGTISPTYNFTPEDRLGFSTEGLVITTNRDDTWVEVEGGSQ